MSLKLSFFKKTVFSILFSLVVLSTGIVSEQEYQDTVISPSDQLIIEIFKD